MPVPPIAAERPRTIGVYVHFPYCLAKCPYCDFLSVPREREAIPHRPYADAVLAELERRKPELEGLVLRSVFFGGGTPSLWDPRELSRVLAAIRAAFVIDAEPEITVECNPSSFDETVASALRAASVNRVSLGVQSLNQERLAFLGRLHDARGALSAIEIARQHGFAQVSADLIFGVAGQPSTDAADEARRIAEAGVTHLSAYALTIEPGTQFGELARRGRLPLLGDDAVADSFSAVERVLEERGFEHYEISNYAQRGAAAQHNLGYWRGAPYLGLGAGAWGTLRTTEGLRRYRNTPAIDRYLSWHEAPSDVPIDREGPLVSVVEPLTAEQALSERLMLGLRLAEGVDLAAAERETGAELWTPSRRRAADKWIQRGALTLGSDGRLRVERSRWLLADGIIADLM